MNLTIEECTLATHIYNAWSEAVNAEPICEDDFWLLPSSSYTEFVSLYAQQLLEAHADLYAAKTDITRQCKRWPNPTNVDYEAVFTSIELRSNG